MGHKNMMLTISELNSLNFEDFISKLEEIISSLPLSVKEGILRVHPDLAGRLARNGQLTKESSSEQSQANLDQLTPEEMDTLADLNNSCKSKYGFPFVICARLNKKEAIIVGLQRRLNHTAETEVQNGIEEVIKISQLRLTDIVK